jgi:hypothetical protein
MKYPFRIEKIEKNIHWTNDEDRLLISLVSIHKRKWLLISKSFKDKTGYNCYLRYRSINPDIKKGIWEPFEDENIIEGVKHFGKQWSIIAKTYFSNRYAKQIRDRYMNYLDPTLNKGKFSIEEDYKILSLHNKYGNKWSFIKQFVPGRSSDKIKNRYNASIKRNKKLLMVMGSVNCNLVSTNIF